MYALLLMFGLQAEPMCFVSDVQTYCCPSACAAKNGREWPHADDILRSCMAALGCSNNKTATVFMNCNCK